MKRRRCFSIVPLFADKAVYFPSRTCARPRNKFIVHVFLLLLRMLKKYAA